MAILLGGARHMMLGDESHIQNLVDGVYSMILTALYKLARLE